MFILRISNSTVRLSLLGCGLLAPILLYVVDYSMPKTLSSKLHAYLIYPPAWPRHWQVSIHDTTDVEPTRGQALFILFIILLNLMLTTCDMYSVSQENWTWDLRSGRSISAFANRLGALAAANIPLVILYSTRNNFLLWLTSMFPRFARRKLANKSKIGPIQRFLCSTDGLVILPQSRLFFIPYYSWLSVYKRVLSVPGKENLLGYLAH
jgi:hypothetical protein